MSALLIVFVKWPDPGRVKTRLAQVLGDEEAASIYRELLRRVLRGLKGLEDSEQLWVAFDPPEKHGEIRAWLGEELAHAGIEPQRVEFRAQAAGDLGKRLSQAFSEGFAAGFERVAVIGSDCVEFDLATVREAWSALSDRRVVFGPATDGGYYLVAAAELGALAIFEDVPWSSDRTLEISVERACSAGYEVVLLDRRADVDTVEDWNRVRD